MNPFDYLNTSVKSYQRASKVHGIGLFALIDIKKGEQVFQHGKEKLVGIKLNGLKLKQLPKEVLSYVLRSYGK